MIPDKIKIAHFKMAVIRGVLAKTRADIFRKKPVHVESAWLQEYMEILEDRIKEVQDLLV